MRLLWCVVQNLKVFTCSAPYPVDVFVRLNLRDRGWVEKFAPRMMCAAAMAHTTDRALHCHTDEGRLPCTHQQQGAFV